MKTNLNSNLFCCGFLFLLTFNLSTYCLQDGQALTPPMGFNTWNFFGCAINEATLVNAGHLMIKKHPANWEGREISLKDAGYTYVNIDDCWQANSRDAQGNPQCDAAKFPKGLKWLADTLHQMGLKIGIYSCAGTATCCNYFAAFDAAHPDVGFDQIDATAYAEWGIDYLKEDWCAVPGEYANAAGSQKLYTRMRDALKTATSKTGRPIVFSLCNWGQYSVCEWGDTVGHLWRMNGDITPTWNSIMSNITNNSTGAPYAKPGAWNDPDMMQVGNGTLSYLENRAHFDLWCISAAPLLLGNDFSKMTDSLFTIVSNREVIAVDQDSLGYQGRKVRTDGDVQIWSKKLKNGAWAVVLVNNSTENANSSVQWSDIGEPDLNKSYPVRDLWQHKIMDQAATGSYMVNNIPGHSTVHLVFGKAYWMEPASGSNDLSPAGSSRPPANTVLVRKSDRTISVYIPFAASNVTILDLQGKQLRSFFIEEPSWKTFLNSGVSGQISIVRVIPKNGRTVTRTINEAAR
jgi:alpha-galactosidase